MARELAAVYSQVFDLSFKTSLLTFCDPRHIDLGAFQRNKKRLKLLIDALYSHLVEQNRTECSCLSLELEHLIINTYITMQKLETCLNENIYEKDYFAMLHLSDLCCFHKTVNLCFYGDCVIPISLSIINDIEIFFSRLNSVFYCISGNNALEGLEETINFLGTLRNISPIPLPDLYLPSISCMNCLNETSILPNQGENVFTIMNSINCTHVATPVAPEPVQGLFENELMHLNIPVDGTDNKVQLETSDNRIQNASIEAIDQHNIFEKVSQHILEISNLIYWNSGHSNDQSPKLSCSQMATLIQHETRMASHRQKVASHLALTTPPIHFFDSYRAYPIESLFCGGIFYSIMDNIQALKQDCSTTFLAKSNYRTIMERKNELYVRLNNLLAPSHTKDGDIDKPNTSIKQARTHTIGETTSEQIFSDAAARKNNYLQKVTTEGLKKITDCLETQGKIMCNTLTLRTWGVVTYKEAAILKNHFMIRKRFIALPQWHHNYTAINELYESSKFIKNSLYVQKLSQEHIDSITLQFYSLITGPLVEGPDFFPSPPNILLANCLDAAKVMPHHKMLISEVIWPSMEPKDWIDAEFNAFYNITGKTLNSVQQCAWRYIRELVMSVSLYNRVWEKDLNIVSPSTLSPHNLFSPKPTFKSGIYITYEKTAPLIFIHDNTGWIFKDLYALLYHHLQLTSHKNVL
nr:transport protein [Bovine gammaherpesvirus 4]